MTQHRPRLEVVLLNLKWFANRLARSFESKFQSALERNNRHRPLQPSSSTDGVENSRKGISNAPPFAALSRLFVSNVAVNRLSNLKMSTSEMERKESVDRFASQICLVYEYQLGSLKDYKNVRRTADYVAELILKALRTGTITNLSPGSLTLNLFFESCVRPHTASRPIKTATLGPHEEQLQWKVGELFTQPGVRHNEVSGEENLTITSHFLSPFTPFGETRRPDQYGYRNLIVTPKTGHEENIQYTEIFPEDAATLKHGKSLTDDEEEGVLLHFHRTYQPVFFLLYDRPEVLEHLLECDIFGTFCSSHQTTPIMFVNQFVENLSSTCPLLFHNFDIFNVFSYDFGDLEENTSCATSEADTESIKSVAFDNQAFTC